MYGVLTPRGSGKLYYYNAWVTSAHPTWLTDHYHLKLPNGKPLGVDSKYAMISGEGVFDGSDNKDEKEKRVKEVESDEIWGVSLMVAGTLIWGYGSYLI